MPGGILLSWSYLPELMFKTSCLFWSCLFLFAYKEYRSGANTSLGLHCHLVNTLRLFWQCYLFISCFFVYSIPSSESPEIFTTDRPALISSRYKYKRYFSGDSVAIQRISHMMMSSHRLRSEIIKCARHQIGYDDWVYACINVRWI